MKTLRTGILIVFTATCVATVSGTVTHSEQVKIVTTDGGTNLWIETDDNDSVITFHDPGNHWTSLGIDKSDSGHFKIKPGGNLTGSGGLKIQTDGRVFIDFSGSPHPKGMLSFGAAIQKKMFAVYESPTAWYGFGIQSGEFRMQTGNTSSRFSFLAGDDNPIVTFLGNGNVGIGDTSPSSLLNVSSGTDGDAVFLLEADTDNSTENDNPRIEFLNDGALVGAMIGFREEEYESGESSNLLRISAYQPSSGVYDAITIDPYTQEVGIGTENPLAMFDVGGSFVVQGSGNVGIGTISPDYKLDVNGTIRAKEFFVETGWSDFVFADTYHLPPLSEVEEHIEKHGHLPGVPSAAEIKKDGLEIGQSQKILMQKIEELTLYMLEMKKENDALNARVRQLEIGPVVVE